VESAGQEREGDLKSRRISGAGGEEELGGQEEEEGAKRRKRTSVRGGAVEGERVEGGKATSTQCDLVMQQLITYDRNDPTSFFPSFIA